tara:strand:+ start:348 stop:557 length:210 start_codon:yes stop_codon:yes gene_type:complete
MPRPPDVVLGIGSLILGVRSFQMPTPQDLVLVDHLTAVEDLLHLKVPSNLPACQQKLPQRADGLSHFDQ